MDLVITPEFYKRLEDHIGNKKVLVDLFRTRREEIKYAVKNHYQKKQNNLYSTFCLLWRNEEIVNHNN